ncbi:hypothetical protein SO694_0001510 [Aureococcus anophagefferens]|uniref:Uncharacterized protein n=1 Tax=Aureococcus anophagefferens TaxID=44056 RepID=A0ABR1G2A1_AURAN
MRVPRRRVAAGEGRPREGRRHRRAVWKSNLQPDFNLRVCDHFDASSSTVF